MDVSDRLFFPPGMIKNRVDSYTQEQIDDIKNWLSNPENEDRWCDKYRCHAALLRLVVEDWGKVSEYK